MFSNEELILLKVEKNYKRIKNKIMDYAFKLKWDELDEDLKRKKIDNYINNCGREMTREEAEKQIKSHFPVYF
ncbi:MAG: hypothetical protein DDT40_01738 [candidate division WS2 bacterium]|nr:hypothetical protein [Candidatus Psychracetigena formicireducens]